MQISKFFQYNSNWRTQRISESKLFSLLVEYISLQRFQTAIWNLLLWHSDFRFSKTWPSLEHLDLFEFIFCQEIWWLWWKPGELNLSMSAEKMIIVVYSQEMRGNLCLHCPKLPHPFSHKKCIHLDDNAWKKFLIFYKGRREDAFNPLFIQRSGFGWYEGTDKINSNCRSPSQRG